MPEESGVGGWVPHVEGVLASVQVTAAFLGSGCKLSLSSAEGPSLKHQQRNRASSPTAWREPHRHEGLRKREKQCAAWKQPLFNQRVQSPLPEQQPRQVERGRGWGKRETSLSCFAQEGDNTYGFILEADSEGVQGRGFFTRWALAEGKSARIRVVLLLQRHGIRSRCATCFRFSFFRCSPVFAWAPDLSRPAAGSGPRRLSGGPSRAPSAQRLRLRSPPQEPQQGDRTPSVGSPPRVPHLVWLVRIAVTLCPLDGHGRPCNFRKHSLMSGSTCHGEGGSQTNTSRAHFSLGFALS